MKWKQGMLVAMAMVLLASGLAVAAGKAEVVAKAELKWKDMGNGVTAAPVSGDMEKGASRFYLKYPAGFVTPLHHHTADHYVTVVSGAMSLTVDGKVYKLVPGSYFALTGKIPHTAKVEGSEVAVFFVQADGPWDVHMEK